MRTTSFFLGISTVTCLRLCCRAPVMMMRSSSIRTANYNRGMTILPAAAVAAPSSSPWRCHSPAATTPSSPSGRARGRPPTVAAARASTATRFTVRQLCFCVDRRPGGPFVVTVVRGQVVSVVYTAEGTDVARTSSRLSRSPSRRCSPRSRTPSSATRPRSRCDYDPDLRLSRSDRRRLHPRTPSTTRSTTRPRTLRFLGNSGGWAANPSPWLRYPPVGSPALAPSKGSERSSSLAARHSRPNP